MTGADSLETAISRLAARTPIVAVKCGSRGSIVQSGSERYVAPPLQVAPVDTIGAGDSYNAGFLRAYTQGMTLQQCAAAGNASAALSTLRSGGTEAFREKSLLCSFLAADSNLFGSIPACSDTATLD
jgi:sugar/nucleoside kinase (ribokinase family)